MRRPVLSFLLLLPTSAVPVAAVLPPPSYDATGPANPAGGPTLGRSFIVNGSDLKSRLEVALDHARLEIPRTPFWVAYAFRVRAVEKPRAEEGPTAVSLLFRFTPNESIPHAVRLVETERPRDADGLPIYWLGSASNRESVALLRSFLGTPHAELVAETLTRALGLHDVPLVTPVLHDLALRSPLPAVRATAAEALAHLSGRHSVLLSAR